MSWQGKLMRTRMWGQLVVTLGSVRRERHLVLYSELVMDGDNSSL